MVLVVDCMLRPVPYGHNYTLKRLRMHTHGLGPSDAWKTRLPQLNVIMLFLGVSGAMTGLSPKHNTGSRLFVCVFLVLLHVEGNFVRYRRLLPFGNVNEASIAVDGHMRRP